eukprot:307370_1
MAEEAPKKKKKRTKSTKATKPKKKIGFVVEEKQEEEDKEAKLLKLSRFSPLRFRHGAQHYMKQYKDLVYDIASQNDDETANAKQKISEERFIEIFDGKIGKELCKEIFNMIYDGIDKDNDDGKENEND